MARDLIVNMTILLSLLVCCAALQSYASLLSDNLLVDELYKQLHNLAKGEIDVECDSCFLIVKTIQFLSRENKSEDEIVDAAIELCTRLKIEDKYVCSAIVPEFKVSYLTNFSYVTAVQIATAYVILFMLMI